MPRRRPRNSSSISLPASWSGQPPSLPPEVIADLARRAREADRLERKERQAVAQQRASAEPVRVHVATQPTFTRYIFAIPASTAVSTDRAKERLTLTFDAPIKFDLADVVAALPRAIGGIDSRIARRHRAGALQLPGQGRRPHLPRRRQLYARYRRRRQQAGRGQRGAARRLPRPPLRSKVRRPKPPRRQQFRLRRRTTLPRPAPKRQRRQRRKNPTSRHRQQSPRPSNRQRRPRRQRPRHKRRRRQCRPTNRRQRQK